MKTINIGPVHVEPGTKGNGFIKAGKNPWGSSIDVPVIIVNGTSDGPRLWVTACVHGSEFHGTLALHKTAESLDPKRLKGTFIAIPAFNISAFEAGDRVSPYDKVDMNRIFPGDPKGSYTQQLAYRVFQEIATNTDYLIDLHSGQKESMCPTWVIYPKVGGKVGEESEMMAKVWGYEYLCGRKPEEQKGFLYREVAERGIPAITPEGGGGSRILDEYTDRTHQGIMNVMRYLQMIEGSPKLLESYKYMSEWVWPKATTGGIFRSFTHVLDRVSEGQIVATICNIFGKKMEDIKSPFDGVILFERIYPIIKVGDPLLIIGR